MSDELPIQPTAEPLDESGGRALVESWRASGLSGAAYCRRHGLRPPRLAYWRERLGYPIKVVRDCAVAKVDGRPSTEDGGFVQVVASAPAASTTHVDIVVGASSGGWALTIHLGGQQGGGLGEGEFERDTDFAASGDFGADEGLGFDRGGDGMGFDDGWGVHAAQGCKKSHEKANGSNLLSYALKWHQGHVEAALSCHMQVERHCFMKEMPRI